MLPASLPIPLEIPLLAFGASLILAMFAFMLRRSKVRVAVEPAGLLIGGRAAPWNTIRRLCYSRSRGQGGYRIFTDAGAVAFTQDQTGYAQADALRDDLVRLAALSETDPEHRPSGFPKHPTDVYQEWEPLAAQIAAVPIATPDAGVSKAAKKKGAGILAAIGIALWKFGKWALIGLKFGAKALKLGKALPTMISMLVTVWAYSMLWGWTFAVGFVVLIFLHELGHAIVIRAKGLRTGPIVFLPFIGAFINIKGQMMDATVEAETAYGGPAAGALAATACSAIHLATGNPFWLHLAYVGYLLNLFNLLPVSPLDGGRIVTAISTWLWGVGLLLAGALAWYTLNFILILVVIFGIGRLIREWKARRAGGSGDYYRVPGRYRALIAFAYFGLCGYLGFMVYHSLHAPGAAVR